MVKNTGHDTAIDVKLDDPLPTTGGLTWSVFSASARNLQPIPASQVLHCDLGNLAPNASVTVVVKSSNANGAPPQSCTGQKLDNIGTASATNAPAVTDHGDYTCSHTTLNVVKTPDNGTFAQGGQVNYNIVVSNTGFSPAINAKLSDQLPTNGGLTWTGVTTSQGSCSISATYLLTCSFGTIPVGGSVTVTVSSPLTTPDAACTSQPNPIALATADNAANAQDAGSQSCTITRGTPRLVVVKTPDGGTFTQGGPVSFTIVVSNGGQANSVARAVTLNDQLPTNGTLNWSSATVTTTQGTCSVNASSLLTCTLGDINGTRIGHYHGVAAQHTGGGLSEPTQPACHCKERARQSHC